MIDQSMKNMILKALKDYVRLNEEQGYALDVHAPKVLENMAIWAASGVDDHDKAERAEYDRLKKKFGS